MNKKPKHMRVRGRDLDKAIFRPDNQKEPLQDHDPSTPLPNRQVWAYAIDGQQDYNDADDYPLLFDTEEVDAEDRGEALAKKVVIGDRDPKYYIKRSGEGRFLNPLGIDERRHNKDMHNIGRREFEFMEVNPRAFKFYRDFLKTRNLAHLRNAEREAF